MSDRQYNATLSPVFNRGRPTAAFLDPLLDWALQAPDELFAPNNTPVDIYTVIKPYLGNAAGPETLGWDNLLHRKAAMLEAMRVHAGFESGWNWNEGVDKTNRTSMSSKTGEETGIFQMSFDSVFLGKSAMWPFAVTHDIDTAVKFIPAIKSDHALALEYYARLVRVSIRWAGPLLRHGEDSVYPWLRRAAVAEFMGFLS